MGLDITAYRNLKRIKDIPRLPNGRIDWDSVEDDMDKVILDINSDFPDQARGHIGPGVYKRPTKSEDVRSFRAGSYSGYNGWRAFLCETVLGVSPQEVWKNPDDFMSKPFFELINFSDCEGYIGPIAAGVLFEDFVEHEAAFVKAVEAVKSMDKSYQWFWDGYIESYQDWKKAFRLASDGGVVKFH